MSIIAIACIDANWGIGYQGELLEHIPADMKFFKETTMGANVVMGRKTWDSLPNKPLAGRVNHIISSDPSIGIDLEKAKTWLANIDKETSIYIIGGTSIYEQLLPYCDKAYITKVYKSHENVDSYFPNLDKMENEWELTEESAPASYKDFYYSFMTYNRIS